MSTVLKPEPDDDTTVTRGFLRMTLYGVGRAVGKEIKAAIAPVLTRLSTVETRAGALSMVMIDKGHAAEKIAELESLLARVADQEVRLRALEARPVLRYMGIWSADDAYREGDFCTDHGSLWHLNVPTTKKRPGDGADWQLAAKKGRDAR